MDFTAIDFETANCARGSICAVGLVRVENGKTVATLNTLVDPRADFDRWCMNVHGIRPDDVRGAPTFPEVWQKMRPFLYDNVVAHNAAFDMSCLHAALAEYRPPDAGEFDYICTLSISRRLRGRGGNRLDELARALGIGGFRHHDAYEDAAVCAEIFKIFETRTNVNAFKKRFFPPF